MFCKELKFNKSTTNSIFSPHLKPVFLCQRKTQINHSVKQARDFITNDHPTYAPNLPTVPTVPSHLQSQSLPSLSLRFHWDHSSRFLSGLPISSFSLLPFPPPPTNLPHHHAISSALKNATSHWHQGDLG